MAARVLFLLLVLSAIDVYPQNIPVRKTGPTPIDKRKIPVDDLLKHISAAESFQISRDLGNAAVENKAVVGIALQRLGNVAIEDGRYEEAVRILDQTLTYADTASNRTNLAIAYLRQNQLDKAITEARKAESIDPGFTEAQYVLGHIYFLRQNYSEAVPKLENVLKITSDFESVHALAMSYLNLRKLDLAKPLFDKMQTAIGKETVDLRMQFARDYERANYPLEAEREIQRALAIDPKRAKLNFYLGYLILQNGGTERMRDAGVAFENELKLSPDDFYSIFFVGVVESSENNHEKAVKYFQRALTMKPRSGEAYLFLAQSQIELNDLPAAEVNLRRAIELESPEIKGNTQARRTHFMLGRLLLRVGKKEEGEKELAIAGQLQRQSLSSARDDIDQILGQVAGDTTRSIGTADASQSPKTNLTPERSAELKRIGTYLAEVLARAFHNLGVIALQNGQTSEAIERFSSASLWKPDFEGLDRNWGIVYFRAGRYAEAVGPLARHLQSNSADKLIRQMLGTSYYLTNDFSKAVETLKPVESTITTDPELAYSYGISLVQLKRNQEANAIFAKLVEVSQNSPEALFYAAQGFMLAGEFERAANEFSKIILLSPKQERANYLAGQCLIRLNQFDEAEKAFSRELEIRPNDPLSKYHLALTFIERKVGFEKAISLLNEAITLDPNYADAFYQLGKIYLEKGDLQKAIAQLESAAASDTNKDFVQYQLSIAYRKSNRITDADRALKRYQELKAANRKADSPM